MLGGTVSEVVDDEREMIEPLAGAAEDKVTVQDVCAPEEMAEGEQARFVTDTRGCRATVAVEEAAPSVAVMRTL